MMRSPSSYGAILIIFVPGVSRLVVESSIEGSRPSGCPNTSSGRMRLANKSVGL